jgi:hypothetical protein
MDIIIAVVVLALVVLAVKYYLDHKKPDVVANPEPEAPYKVEPPVEAPVETSAAPVVTAPVKPATPELKVVNGAKRSLAPKTPAQRVKKRVDVKPAIKPVAKPTAKPKSPRKPKPTSTPTP